jgi:hypothetical protein
MVRTFPSSGGFGLLSRPTLKPPFILIDHEFMPNSTEKLAKIAARAQQTLVQLRAARSLPGSILEDVRTLLDFIGTRDLATVSKHGNLPGAVLPELNRLLSQPIKVKLQRGLLKDYPNIGGPFALLRVMDLLRPVAGRLQINPGALEVWHALNPTEKYFALMEAWLIHVDGTSIGSHPYETHDLFHDNVWFLQDHRPDQWKSHRESVHSPGMHGIPAWDAQLMARFGWIDLQARPLEGREWGTAGWIMGKTRRTLWGEAALWVFGRFIQEQPEADNDDCFFYHLPEEADYGFFRRAFHPYFPEWQKSYSPPRPPERIGLYVFKVGFDPRDGQGNAWRRIGLPHGTTLAEVARIILDVFGFYDHDHLYEFRYHDELGRTRRYYHEYTDEGPYAWEVSLGECGLPEKRTMRFLFDFGDKWSFLAKLERIDPPDPDLDTFKLIDSEGQPPEQYGEPER